MRPIIACLLIVAGTSAALSHDAGPGSWMNMERLTDPLSGAWCCSQIDCHPMPAGSVQQTDGGYLVEETGEVIAKPRVIWRSPDGLWWRCAYGVGALQSKTRCLIGPVGPNS